ncbi:hypothetical protein N7539_001144 [Penicillium diatomitis]|uniref:Biogenesis of lysosome-related organelles complex 1 subunit 1 n=1 Tax=Penicillium diatomitis TaxID=2819901 RepID=A0A9X0C2V1_9EURO|nr:uncharacterized protein N7539_001144 [Penicillium diatomitis]KAJ5496028.1 hypothetical protein N7539_001144 [Penicillium diatomitis]
MDTNMTDYAPSTTHLPDSTEDHQKQEALAAFTATLRSVGTNLEAPLRDRAAIITANEAALQRQEAELVEHTAQLARQNAQWTGWAEETREGLKEIGDVQNWAEMIERDLLILEDMMDGVEMRENEEDEGDDDDREHRGQRGVSEEDEQMGMDEILRLGVAGDEDGPVQNGNGLWQGKGKKADDRKSSRFWLRWWSG